MVSCGHHRQHPCSGNCQSEACKCLRRVSGCSGCQYQPSPAIQTNCARLLGRVFLAPLTPPPKVPRPGQIPNKPSSCLRRNISPLPSVCWSQSCGAPEMVRPPPRIPLRDPGSCAFEPGPPPCLLFRFPYPGPDLCAFPLLSLLFSFICIWAGSWADLRGPVLGRGVLVYASQVLSLVVMDTETAIMSPLSGRASVMVLHLNVGAPEGETLG